MRGKTILFILVVVFSFPAGVASAAEKRIIDFHNAYGGITTRAVYSKGEKPYQDGFQEIENFYAKAGPDGIGHLRKIVYIHTKAHGKEYGFFKTVIYQDKDGKQKKVILYDRSGNIIREIKK